MKKIIAIGLAAALSLTVLAGCGGNDDKTGKNTAPTISGVSESATVMAGEEWDALKGVTASDAEDGDLTSEIEVSARGLTFENGKTTPAEPNESRGYQVRYTVKDSGGLEAEEQFCTLYVTQKAAELVNVFTADFSDLTPKYDWAEDNEGEGNNHWWSLTAADGSAATATLKEGRLEVDVTNRNNVGDDKLMLVRGFDDLPAGKYKFAVWAKATPDVKINMNAILDETSLDMSKIVDVGGEEGNGDEKWAAQNLGGGKYGEQVTAEYKVFALDFEIARDALNSDQAKVLFRICLGGNDNANAFKFDVEKITIWKTTGVNKETDVFDQSGVTSVADLGLTVDAGDGAENHVSTGFDETDKAAKVEVSQYNTTGGCWSIVAHIPVTGKTINTTDTYGYSFDIKADNAYGKAEVHCGLASNRDKGNVMYSGDVGEINSTYKHLYHTFKFEEAYSEIAVHIFLGKQENSPSAASNNIYIKNFRFFKVEGDEETTKIQDKFILFGDASYDKTNKKYPISVYNQSDDAFDAAAMGTAYFENGKLVYLIHQSGSDWGHNKLAFGYWDNPIGPLPANAYYVVSFKIKASVALDFSLTLHDMEMSFVEADGGIPIRYADYGGHEMLHAGTEETTIEVSTQMASLVAHNKCELLLEFGKHLGTNKEVKIEISELKIGYRTVQA